MAELPSGEFLLPLFPLPNLVFFPQTRLPLHVFEPRYRQLVSDIVKSDARFGIVLLKDGWETDYYGSPPIHEYGTIAQIEQSLELPDGRYNLIVNGIARFRIIEAVSEKPYRVARVIAEPEQSSSMVDAWAQREWLADLSHRYLEFLPGNSDVPEIATANLGALTNALIMSLSLEIDEKQKLLETSDLLERANRVGAALEERLQTLRSLAPFRRDGDPNAN